MNISKKVKWSLAGCGFLGANGLVIPSLSNSFLTSSFSIDNISLGGGHSQFNQSFK